MVADGAFPFVEATDPTASPRVGDGLVVLDASGRVEFASPNATSAFRRMGTNALPLGQPLPHRAAILVAEAMAGGRPVESEIDAAGAVTDIRVVPLLRGAGRRGALVLVREATELRRRDRVISRREATIREVHHRVKNNLQTVASLLRLQARRLGDHPQAVAALEDSVRRITSIALVHETLTEEFEGAVDMADVARRIVKMLAGSLGREDAHIELHTASVRVDAAVATPLAVVLNELVQNAVEHGLGDGRGTVTVQLRGGEDEPVVLEVHDDGEGHTLARPGTELGPPEGGGLGLRLVRALVEEELNGQFTLSHPAGRGSIATAVVPPVEREA
jgi:two-component sensor histidine kinase